MTAVTVVDDQLIARLDDPEVRRRTLVLGPHEDFPGHWIVDGFTDDYLIDLRDILGSYRAVAPSGLEALKTAADEFGYQLVWFEDPADMLGAFEHLNDVPDVTINSSFANTVNGMMPFQVQGYNMLREQDYGVARWDTGTGKTVLATALIKHYWEDFDTCFVVVKKNNKVNTQRKLWKLGNVMTDVVSGTKAKRLARWELHAESTGGIVVLNYEQFKDFTFRDDEKKLCLSELGERIFTGTNLMFVWDEMPIKLKSRTSELYKSICKCLYSTAPPQVSRERQRPSFMRHYMLSATPIENTPEDFFNCVRLMDGGRTYGTVTEFNDEFVSHWNFYDPTKPDGFHNLERMRLKAVPFIHQASKTDPDIAAVFPKAIEEVVYIEWTESLSAVYAEVQSWAKQAVEEAEVGQIPIFSLICTLQMICDAPEMINDSAARREVYGDALQTWQESPQGAEPRTDGSEFALALPEALRARMTNKAHPKLERLREILLERHVGDQVAIYTRLNQTLMPYLEAALADWGVSYGRYDGTDRQKQAVQDAFQAGEIRVFLASDAASDSLDLDAGNVVIDYSLPWKWTTLTQRHNRVHRPTSSHDTVYYYSLVMEGSVEERTLQIIEKKRGYHNELFDPASGDFSASARLTKEDLMYVLTGE